MTAGKRVARSLKAQEALVREDAVKHRTAHVRVTCEILFMKRGVYGVGFLFDRPALRGSTHSD